VEYDGFHSDSPLRINGYIPAAASGVPCQTKARGLQL